MNVLIIGCRGQDGRWLTEILSTRGHNVYGIHKFVPSTKQNPTNTEVQKSNQLIEEYSVDFSKYQIAYKYLDNIQPNLIFHLAAVHKPSTDMKDFETSKFEEMQNCHVKITYNLLEWMNDKNKSAKLAVALTSQMYSSVNGPMIISEDSETSPQNVYGKTKADSFKLIQEYRKNKGLYTSGLILFNHTSIYAKPNFLFKALAKQINDYRKRLRSQISILNADYKIDICDAREVCEAMRLSLKNDHPKDYVISSGNLTSIRSIIKDSAKLLNFSIDDQNILSTINVPQKNILLGNPSRIFRDLGWSSQNSPARILANIIENESLL